jgi:thiol-disulfide isomerase/thioredoxin
MTKIFAILGAVLILGGGAYFLTQNSAPQAMEKGGGDAMMEKAEDSAMEKEAMMGTEEDAMMQKENGEMMEKKDESAMMQKDESAMMAKGSYEAYGPEKLAKAENGDVVLFFRASWCPTCRALDADIKANSSSIPGGLTILDVDYDKSSDLKKKYGVTTQHTLVQVDASGNLIAKWQGSSTLSGLVSKVK